MSTIARLLVLNPAVAPLLASFVLGLRHGGRSWQAWSPLGRCFYLMHRAAIARGYRPPYVEEDADLAILSLRVLWPTGLGLVLGAFVRFPISRLCAAGWHYPPFGPDFRGSTPRVRIIERNRLFQ